METDRPTETLAIEGMSCTHCVAAVRAALESVPGASVLSVEVGSAKVSLDPARADRRRKGGCLMLRPLMAILFCVLLTTLGLLAMWVVWRAPSLPVGLGLR